MFLQDSFGRFCSVLLVGLLSACAPDTSSPPNSDPPAIAAPEIESNQIAVLQGLVNRARSDYDLIAIGAVVASSDGILETAVDGVQASNRSDPVTPIDRWHIGSNTKALTALLYGKLVERGDSEWGVTLPQLFPELADDMDPAWHDVTIEDLFSHRSGLKQMGGSWLNARHRDQRPVSEQRREVSRLVLSNPPSKDPDTFNYNNLNYIIAGAAIENILRNDPDQTDTWEEAMQTVLFDALHDPAHQNGFGFGPPQAGLEGHRSIFGAFPRASGRGASADNPVVLGPAGTLHATLDAHAALAIEFLRDDSAIVSPALRDHLFTPYPDQDGDYAMGWGVFDHSEYGRMYQHSGSNTMWYSSILVVPRLDRVIIVNVNQFSDKAQSAASELTRELLDAAAPPQPTP